MNRKRIGVTIFPDTALNKAVIPSELDGEHGPSHGWHLHSKNFIIINYEEIKKTCMYQWIFIRICTSGI